MNKNIKQNALFGGLTQNKNFNKIFDIVIVLAK